MEGDITMKSENSYGFDFGADDVPEIDMPKSDHINTNFPNEYSNSVKENDKSSKEKKQ